MAIKRKYSGVSGNKSQGKQSKYNDSNITVKNVSHTTSVSKATGSQSVGFKNLSIK